MGTKSWNARQNFGRTFEYFMSSTEAAAHRYSTKKLWVYLKLITKDSVSVSFTKYLRKLLRNCFPSWKSHLFKSSSRNKLVSGQLWKKILKNVFAKYHLVLEYNFSLYEAIKNSVPTLSVEYIWKPLIETLFQKRKNSLNLSFLFW